MNTTQKVTLAISALGIVVSIVLIYSNVVDTSPLYHYALCFSIIQICLHCMHRVYLQCQPEPEPEPIVDLPLPITPTYWNTPEPEPEEEEEEEFTEPSDEEQMMAQLREFLGDDATPEEIEALKAEFMADVEEETYQSEDDILNEYSEDSQFSEFSEDSEFSQNSEFSENSEFIEDSEFSENSEFSEVDMGELEGLNNTINEDMQDLYGESLQHELPPVPDEFGEGETGEEDNSEDEEPENEFDQFPYEDPFFMENALRESAIHALEEKRKRAKAAIPSAVNLVLYSCSLTPLLAAYLFRSDDMTLIGGTLSIIYVVYLGFDVFKPGKDNKDDDFNY